MENAGFYITTGTVVVFSVTIALVYVTTLMIIHRKNRKTVAEPVGVEDAEPERGDLITVDKGTKWEKRMTPEQVLETNNYSTKEFDRLKTATATIEDDVELAIWREAYNSCIQVLVNRLAVDIESRPLTVINDDGTKTMLASAAEVCDYRAARHADRKLNLIKARRNKQRMPGATNDVG